MVKSSVFLAISYTKRMKVENAIRKYLESKGLEVITGRDVASGGNLCDEIISLIQQCDFGVVVYNELRHNISYEWGLLDALKKNVVLLKDENIHINLDEELSDKKGLVFTPFYGEDAEDDIIEQLKKDKGLERALENNIEKRISKDKTPNAKKATELLVKSDLQLGEVPQNIKELPNSEEIIKSLEKIKNLTAEGHLIKGNAYYSEKKFNKAIEEYTEAIELNPKDANAYYNRGTVYGKDIKEFDKAIEDYNKTIEIDPKHANAYNNRGNVYINIKKFDKAIEDYNKTIEIYPKDANAYNNRGIVYTNIKKFDKAIEDFNKAIELNPKLAEAYNNRGVVYTDIKEFDKAIKDYNKAIVLNPKDAGTYLNLAEVYIIGNNYKDSLEVAQKSLEISKDIKDIIISKFFIALNLILQGRGEKEEKEIIEFCNQNKGYKLTFEFEALKDALKDSEYSGKINNLIKLIEENAKRNS